MFLLGDIKRQNLALWIACLVHTGSHTWYTLDPMSGTHKHTLDMLLITTKSMFTIRKYFIIHSGGFSAVTEYFLSLLKKNIYICTVKFFIYSFTDEDDGHLMKANKMMRNKNVIYLTQSLAAIVADTLSYACLIRTNLTYPHSLVLYCPTEVRL